MGGFRIVMFLFDSGIFSKTNGALIFGHGLTELGATGVVHQYRLKVKLHVRTALFSVGVYKNLQYIESLLLEHPLLTCGSSHSSGSYFVGRLVCTVYEHTSCSDS